MNKYVAIALSLFLLASCKKEVVVFNDGPNAELELPLILRLDGKDCFYDEATGVLKYAIDANTAGDFAPQTEFQESSAVVFDGKPLKNHTVNAFGPVALHKRYSVAITTNGVVKHLQLVFTDMPLVRIVAFDGITNEPKTLAKMTVNYAESGEPAAVDWIGIELRGASSLSFPKKSYGIAVCADKSTDHPVKRSYFGMQENSRWILDAMYADNARCRNKSTFALWRSMGEDNHPGIRSVFVEVFLNNRSLGLYAMNEHFSEDLLGMDAQSVLYKGIDNSEVTFFERLPGKEPSSARWAEWEQKFPDPSDNIEWDDFRELAALIVNGSDAQFTQNIGAALDLDNAMDYYLFVNLCGGQDNVGKNWHFLKRSPTGRFTIVPWDLDATWGRSTFGDAQSSQGIVTNHLFDRLQALNPENYNERLRQRWQELRSAQFSEEQLFSLFAANFSALKHYHILETENGLWQQSLGFGQEQAYIQSWIADRLAYLDALFQ